ncbi:MAG: type I DNA topoisomerase [Proteobacteria bacterium]|nr:type I DNA topoisomerase [Pseudomonadota bacterium]MBU4472219.1 type I DNA topoisomerase [Pseudomonadota bacterium]MCG2750428.1 type I DNA topoisomerase [Desulfobacteraceae bacterium]
MSSKPLVIVESPTKVRTIKKYLGKDYNVVATVGHIRDLPVKEIGIDIENGFTPQYRTIPGKQKVIKSLKDAAGDTDEIFLAPDPDREGEAIAWHTAEVLKKEGRKFHRVLFHELTQKAILEAMNNPRDLDHSKYEAQQARRILDRLVGYQVSPVLWKKVKSGLSAGRVQSVAVRIICEREREIQKFNPEEYWSITAHLEDKTPPVFQARLVKKNDHKLAIPDEKASDDILSELAGKDFVVDKISKKTIKRNPAPPFITSKLQQEAIRKLRFTAKKTMMVAQQLYEGIDLGPGEPEGLITYMRTDSIRISEEAANEALSYIKEKYGTDYSLDQPRYFKNKNKAQDAHEAIRPTSVYNTPEKIKSFLSSEQFALYSMIWERFVASQMQQALINQNSVSIKAGAYTFTVSGSSIKFPGFLSVYRTADDEMENKEQEDRPQLPELSEGTVLNLLKLDPKQHFTQPPPRFSEASLVKELEENGIGRPSTYAAILSTIRNKEYVEMLKGYFKPSELGFIVNDILVENFQDVFNVDFTARMENNLDRIETEQSQSLEVLSNFYAPFKLELDKALSEMLSVKGVGVPTSLNCPTCGKKLFIKIGKNGPFLACSGYPECAFTRDYVRDEKGVISPVESAAGEQTDILCEKCRRPMVVRKGKFGDFLACSGYPECKNTRSRTADSQARGKGTGVQCPEKGCAGEILEKHSKRGKVFYGCNRYPDCSFAIWDKPAPKKCPQCGADFLVEKTSKKKGTFLSCTVKDCGYEEIQGTP